MKMKILGILAVVILPVFAFTFTNSAHAQTFRKGETTNIAASEQIDGSAWMAGSTIDVAGKVNGDLFCVGKNVTITGEVDGDVLCAAQTLTLSGTVTGDVRLAGQAVMIDGSVAGSASIVGQSITVDGQGKVGRDASLVGQNMTINGQVGRDVVVRANNVTTDNVIGRNLTATVDNLTFANNTVINGNVTYMSPQKVTMASNAHVAGKIGYTKQTNNRHTGYDVGNRVLWFIILVVSALVFALLFPRELYKVTNYTTSVSRALFALLIGFVAGIIVPVATVLLMITVIGAPLGLILIVGWLFIVAVSGAFAAYYVGRSVWQSQTNSILIMLVGALILAIASMIPILDAIVWLLAIWYGSGTILLCLKAHLFTPIYDTKKFEVPARKVKNA